MMRDLLIQQGLHKLLDVGAKKSHIMKVEKWADLDERASSTIRLNLSDDVVHIIIDEDTACVDKVEKPIYIQNADK